MIKLYTDEQKGILQNYSKKKYNILIISSIIFIIIISLLFIFHSKIRTFLFLILLVSISFIYLYILLNAILAIKFIKKVMPFFNDYNDTIEISGILSKNTDYPITKNGVTFQIYTIENESKRDVYVLSGIDTLNQYLNKTIKLKIQDNYALVYEELKND